MKKLFAIFVVILFSLSFVCAQRGISFQGIARDNEGNAIANQTINVRFEIGPSDLFTEIHTGVLTDNYGVFSAIIGSVENEEFNNINYSDENKVLSVTIDGYEIYNGPFSTVPYAKHAENGAPVGSIMPYAGEVTSGKVFIEVSPGWVVCNGADIPNDPKYDELKSILGNNWGTNVLPDLRSLFLRGISGGRSDSYADPDNAREVGSLQADENKSHLHTGSTNTDGAHQHKIKVWGSGDNDGDGAYVLNDADGGNQNVQPDDKIKSYSDGSAHNHAFTTGNTGISESRPNNAGINYIIKY